jgi:hypothetical protein
VDYYLDGAYQTSDFVSSLAGNTAFTRTDLWLYVATSGNHTLKMIIDPFNAVAESNEGDNIYEQTFFWNPPPYPDLIVQSVTVTPPSPTVSTTADVAVTIRNQGTVATSSNFATDFYSNRGTAPAVGQAGDLTHTTTVTLNPGATESFHFFPSSAVATTWSSWVQVDRTGIIDENANEGNNVYGPISITWMPGTAAVSGVLAFNDTSFSGAGPQHPMRCVPVTLFDSDGGTPGNNWAGDDSLAATVTDASGNFSFPAITNRDTDADQGRLDTYVRVQIKNDVTCVGNPVLAVKDSALKTWEWRSTAVTDVANGAPSLGTVKPTDYGTRAALHLYATIFKGYDWALARGLTPPGGLPWYMEVVWQPGYVGDYATTYYAGRKLHIVGEPTVDALTPDEWDDAAVLHEYGHFLADLFGFEPTIPNRPPDGCPHDPTQRAECPPGVPSVQFAWSEGWPSYFSCVTQSTPPNPVRRNTGAKKSGNTWTSIKWTDMNIETGELAQDNGIPLPSANDSIGFEVANAGVVWDIYDSVVDNQNGDACADSISDGVDHAWDVTANHASNPNWHLGFFYRLYWERYAQSDPTLDRQLTQVFCEHAIPASGGNTVSAPQLPNLRLALGVAPNPARGPVTVRYSIPAELGNAPVAIGVFDVAGRLVRRLRSGSVGLGVHQIAWDGLDDAGRPTSSGMYFCRLVAADQKRLLRFVVVR